MATSRAEQIATLRNRAILSALDAALKLADPTDMDVRIWPFATEAEEQGRRAEISAYIGSWIVGPLVDAIRHTELSDYREVTCLKASAYIEQVDQLDVEARGLFG